MNRRDFWTLGFGGFFGTTAVAQAAHKGVKGYVVATLEVGRLPPYKAEMFVDRVKDSMRKKMPEGWEIIVRPTREDGAGKIEVFAVNENHGDLRAIEAMVYDTKQDRFLPRNRVEEYAEEEIQHIHDYVRLMLGAPIVEMPAEGLEDLIDFYIERGQRYNVNDLQQFVFEMVEAATYVVEFDWVSDPHRKRVIIR